MHEIEDLLRSSLQRNAEDVTPRSEAIQEAVSTVRRRRRARFTLGVAAAVGAVGVVAGGAVTLRALKALHNRGCSWGLNPPLSRSDRAM